MRPGDSCRYPPKLSHMENLNRRQAESPDRQGRQLQPLAEGRFLKASAGYQIDWSISPLAGSPTPAEKSRKERSETTRQVRPTTERGRYLPILPGMSRGELRLGTDAHYEPS